MLASDGNFCWIKKKFNERERGKRRLWFRRDYTEIRATLKAFSTFIADLASQAGRATVVTAEARQTLSRVLPLSARSVLPAGSLFTDGAAESVSSLALEFPCTQLIF